MSRYVVIVYSYDSDELISEARSYVVSNEDAEKSEAHENDEANQQATAAHREVMLHKSLM